LRTRGTERGMEKSEKDIKHKVEKEKQTRSGQ
jgi:hypothetical protein